MHHIPNEIRIMDMLETLIYKLLILGETRVTLTVQKDIDSECLRPFNCREHPM